MSDRVTSAEFRKLAKKRPRVRNARRTTNEGGTFHSKREADRWRELRLEEQAGAITNLRRQVAFSLHVNGEHIGKYVCDFQYFRDGVRCVEDAKGHRTDLFILHKKLMQAIYQIEVIES